MVNSHNFLTLFTYYDIVIFAHLILNEVNDHDISRARYAQLLN